MRIDATAKNAENVKNMEIRRFQTHPTLLSTTLEVSQQTLRQWIRELRDWPRKRLYFFLNSQISRISLLEERQVRPDLKRIEPKARRVYRRYMDELDSVDVKDLAIHRRVSRLNYARRCAEASVVLAHIRKGIPLAPGMEIGYVVKDAKSGM